MSGQEGVRTPPVWSRRVHPGENNWLFEGFLSTLELNGVEREPADHERWQIMRPGEDWGQQRRRSPPPVQAAIIWGGGINQTPFQTGGNGNGEKGREKKAKGVIGGHNAGQGRQSQSQVKV